MKLLKPFHRKTWFWLVGLFVLGLLLVKPSVIGLIGSAGDAIDQTLDFLPLRDKIGEAFLIAAILAAIVDPFLKGELLEEVSKEALSFAAGYVLPDPLKTLLKRIIKVPYTRERFRITLSLSDIPNHPCFVRLTMHTSYDVVNQIETAVKCCTIRTAIERGRWPNIGRSELLAYEITGLPSPIRLGAAELRQLQTDNIGRPYIFYEQEIKLPAAGKGVVHVETTRSIVYPESWFYVLDLLDVTIGVDVELRDENEFDWHVDFGHDRIATETPGHCEHSGAFLPGNFARITWTRKRPVQAPATTANPHPAIISTDPHWPTAADWIARAQSARSVGTLGLLGAPVCRGSITPGRCDLGPAAIRTALAKFSLYDFATERELTDLAIVDFADLDVADATLAAASPQITAAIREAIRKAHAVVLLGGDNSITRPACHGLSDDLSQCALLTVDAHLDLRDLDNGPSNGNPVRGLLQDGLPGAHIVQIGIQSFANSAAYAEVARKARIEVVHLDVVRTRGIETVVLAALEKLSDAARFIYVDFDVDVLDRAFSPASPGSRPGGLLPAELLLAARLCGANKKVVAMDIVEFDPSKDIAGIGALTAASCFLSFTAGYRSRFTG
jgi:formiminoglutamase